MNSKQTDKKRVLTSYAELEAFRAYINSHFELNPSASQNESFEKLISLMAVIALGKTKVQDLDDFYANDYFKLALNLHYYERFNLTDALASTAFRAQLTLISDNIQAQDISLQFEQEALEAYADFENGNYHAQLKPLYLFIHAYMVHKDKLQNEKYDTYKKIEFTHALHSDFLENGYLIIKDFLTPEQMSELKEITHTLAKQELEKESAYLYGNGNKLQRVYNLLNKHEKYRELLVTPTVTGILERVFARDTLHQKYYLSSFQSNILNPGAEAQKLHVDSSVPDPLPPWLIRININFLLDDFTATNGSTLVAPGSHKLLRKPQNNEDITLINVIAPAGSIVMWTGHLWHKTSANTSNHSRTALLACFAASYLREVAVEENYLEVMSKETLKSCSRELQNLLGVGHGIKQGAY